MNVVPNELKCGDTVQLKLDSTKGMITCVANRFDQIYYEISYMYQGELKNIWLRSQEFIVVQEEPKQSIGFKH